MTSLLVFIRVIPLRQCARAARTRSTRSAVFYDGVFAC
jgi:hypothetical protein